jgi:hypothetical protein
MCSPRPISRPIKQGEPTDGTDDGHTCPDGHGIGTSTAQVRAERSGQGDGWVYSLLAATRILLANSVSAA